MLAIDSVWSSLVVVGSSAEVECESPCYASEDFEWFHSAASGGLKALDKSGATEYSSEWADGSSTGGGTVPIPSVVTGCGAGDLSSEVDTTLIAAGSSEYVCECGAVAYSLTDSATV